MMFSTFLHRRARWNAGTGAALRAGEDAGKAWDTEEHGSAGA